MTAPERELRDRLAVLDARPGQGSWRDVERRARAYGYRDRRRWAALVVLASALVVLAAVPAFGVGGNLIDLFRDPDKPALPRTLLDPYMRLEFDHTYGEWSLHEIASGRGVSFYAIRDGTGEVVCVGHGRARHRREYLFRSLGCTPKGARPPFRNRLIDYQVSGTASVRNPVLRPHKLTGVAADAVERVELRGGGETVEMPIEDHVFTTATFPSSKEIRIVALDEEEDVVFSEYLQGFGPRDRRVRRPPPAVFRGPRRPRALPLLPLPDRTPIQRGSAGGASVTIYPPNFVAFRFEPGSASDRLLAGKGVSPSCFKFVRVDGRWHSFGTGGPSRLYRRELRQRLGHVPFKAPYDGCSVQGEYGRRWNDPRGMHAPVEVPLTERGRRFFAERAAARDLAYFVRSPRIKALRRALKRDPSAVLPAAARVARRFPSRVVALPSPTALPPRDAVGVWTDGARKLVATRAVGGRRLFVELRSGRIGRHNLEDLAFVF
jgi:hypothetical protein